MANLLHIDCSIRQDGSVSREVSAIFAERWRAANPGGGYTHRDLGKSPVPHLDEESLMATFLPPESWSETQRAGWAITEPLLAELRAADTVLLAVPMYNYSIPSSLKAWMDRVTVKEHMVNEATGEGTLLVGKRAVVVTARGGSYGPGTPRQDFDFQEPYLRALLSQIGLDKDLTFVHSEMTLAHSVPALEQFKELADTSREQAVRTVRELAAR
ncbi:FMN-dependent NADH-azoreductase [Micromonospora pisi]|uniref:FMN dependent NADH:quinone oxidoreductase n=1 Tax=Micromonospora pisi TaxID=589240 RepID=A0A495JSF7_9ACTN|nr:NAD(P)H-dependent oxidoreductase [Micromonospora pisi]RKR91927.1 FMN-dependent NADH-azoreductase [Micromonospora pisi]